jgi:dTDP-4-amino-4,6-dideoxygalactose transaminase
MMMYLQPPVGNKTELGRPGKGRAGFASLDNWRPAWFASGTAALAAALQAAIQLRAVENPLAIMPAYGCPDLVAAARFAGAEPCFVDLAPGSLGMDLVALRSVLEGNPAIVAVIGIDLFGLPERWQEIRRLCDQYNVVCIRDCAQSLQTPESIDADVESDIRIYSFGRGKPLFLQGGGAALVSSRPDQRFSQALDVVTDDLPQRRQSVSRIVNVLYNAALQPRFYSLLAFLLGDRLGDTRYEPLETLEVPQAGFDAAANAAIQRVWVAFENRQEELVRVLQGIGSAGGAPYFLFNEDIASDCRLLRMPLLMRSREERDVCIDELREGGISATPMYGRALPAIEGVGTDIDVSSFPVANGIAARLMTLPVHAGLRARDFRAIEKILKSMTPI